MFKLKNIISIKDFEREDVEYILDEASKLENIAKSREVSDELKGKMSIDVTNEPFIYLDD